MVADPSQSERARLARQAAPRAAMLPPCTRSGGKPTVARLRMAHCNRWGEKMEVRQKPRAWALRTPFLAPESAQDEIKKAGSPSSVDGGSGRGSSVCVREREGEREGESLAR